MSAATQCPRCTWALESTSGEGPELLLCKRCDGKYLIPKELAESFGEKATPKQWVEDKFATTKVRKSAISCPFNHGQLDAYTLVLAKRELTLRYCDDCEGIWLDTNESKKLGNLLQLRAAALKKAKMNLTDNTGYLFQLFSAFPMGIYFPNRNSPITILVLLLALLYGFLYNSFNLPLPLISDSWMLSSPAFFLGEQPWAILSFALLPVGIPSMVVSFIFLFIFGSHIEDRCGVLGLVLILLYSTLGGAIIHVMVSPESGAPMAGAETAILGLMGAYVILFPKTKLWMCVSTSHFVLSYWIFFVVWCLAYGIIALTDGAHVPWYSQLAGFLCGCSCAFLMRRSWIKRKRFRF